MAAHFDYNSVSIEDQRSRMLDLDFIRALGAPNSLGVATVIDNRNVTLADATGFSDKDVIGIFSGDGEGEFFFARQIGAPAGNVLTLDTPLDRVFPVGGNVIRATDNLASAAGSAAAPLVYQIGPVGAGTEVIVDTTRICGYIQDGTTMDDAMFGSIAGGLTYGIVLRHNNNEINTIWNAKTNGRLALLCASDLNYTDRAPSGSHGARLRNTFAGQEKHGVVVHLLPGDTLEILVQDPEIIDLEVLNFMAQGHIHASA